MLLKVKNLRKERLQEKGQGYALTVPKFLVNSGDKILLSGPSGSGKSTFLDMLSLVLKPDGADEFTLTPPGRPAIDIKSLWQKGALNRLARIRRGLGYVLQTGGLLPFISARRNIELALRTEAKADDVFLEELATRLNISHLLNKLPAQLSVGERQRTAICRALIKKPLIILADEPTAALDPAHAAKVMELFMQMVDELSLTLILVTHDTRQVAGFSGFRHFIIEQNITQKAGISEALLKEAS